MLPASGIVNITFHGIGRPEREIPQEEERYWLEEDVFEDYVALASGASSRGRPVRITFDDGNSSDVEIAMPILQRHRLVGSFFILGGRIGEPGYVDEAGIRRLLKAGMIVGTHGMLHPRWPGCTDDALAAELDQSIARLRTVTGRDIAELAVPFGMYDRRVLGHIRRRPVIKRVFTSDGGYADPNAWLQPRTTIRTDTRRDDIVALLNDERPLRSRLIDKARVWRKRYLT